MAIKNDNSNPTGCSPPLRGCLIASLLVMALFIGVLAYFSRMPSMQAMGECKYNMQELSAAISRYEEVTGHRPEKLPDLAKQYLKDPSVLRCPLDKSSGKTPSYGYNPNANDGRVMLECDRHKIRKDMPNSKLLILGDGKFEIRNPSFRETMKEAEKRSRSSARKKFSYSLAWE